MASPGVCLLPEEEFRCSICLNVFSDPVTTPCGHNFCNTCLTGHWDNDDICQCPKCNKRFHARPEVSINAIIDEISMQIKKRRVDLVESFASDGEVACDICVGQKLAAQNTCLTCLASYCETHLEPHQRVGSLRRHRLVDPVERPEDRVCAKHEKPLDLFCRSEEVCVCELCAETDHKLHETVPIEEEVQKRKDDLGPIKAKIQMMIQATQTTIENVQHSMDICKLNTNKEIETGRKLFSTLLLYLEKIQAGFQQKLEQRQQVAEAEAETIVRRLQQQVTELHRKSDAVDQLSHTDDHLHFLQEVSSLLSTLPTKVCPVVSIMTDLTIGTLRRAVSKLDNKLKAMIKAYTEIELKQMQKFKVNITMDSNTANSMLTVCRNGTRIKYTKEPQGRPDHPVRFDQHPAVLGGPSFTSGRHYWEVQVGVSGKWEVGVANQTINRKKSIKVEENQGFFVLSKTGYSEYKALSSPVTSLRLNPRPTYIGVYVDCEKGQVSFYDVNEKSHIYSFLDLSFTGKMYPYFSLCSMAKRSESITIL